MLQGAAKPPGQPGAPGGGTAAGMFEGEVRVTADKATNALVITSTGHDYAAMRLVIDRLDHAAATGVHRGRDHGSVDRPLDHSRHGVSRGNHDRRGQYALARRLQRRQLDRVPSDPNLLQGAARRRSRGPDIERPRTHRVQHSGVRRRAQCHRHFGGDANVLATPHILATDNVAAEINVGANIPLQTNVGGVPGLGNIGSLLARRRTESAGFNPLALAGLGWRLQCSAPGRGNQDQDHSSPQRVGPGPARDRGRDQRTAGDAAGALGAISITKRTAKTTVVVDDQQTVVIGGLMRDAVVRTQDQGAGAGRPAGAGLSVPTNRESEREDAISCSFSRRT